MEATNNNTNAFMDDLGKLVVKDKVTNTEIVSMYEEHAADYDKSMQDITFQAPALAAKYFHKHARRFDVSKDCAILDVGAGTGRCAQLLQTEYGYRTIDGLDPSEGMLNQARDRGVYRKLFTGKVGAGNKIPADDDTYDAAVAAGCLLPGHMPYDGFLEIIRVVKPGGIIVNSMREEFTWQSADCDIRKPFAAWQIEGKWDIVEWAVLDNEYFQGQDALVHVFKVC